MSNKLDAIIAFVLFLALATVSAYLWSHRDLPRPHPTQQALTAEERGEAVGSPVAGFGKGIVDGAKKRLSATSK